MTDQQIIAKVRYHALTEGVRTLESALSYLRGAKHSLAQGYAEDNYFIANIRAMDKQLSDLVNKARREQANQGQQAQPGVTPYPETQTH